MPSLRDDTKWRRFNPLAHPVLRRASPDWGYPNPRNPENPCDKNLSGVEATPLSTLNTKLRLLACLLACLRVIAAGDCHDASRLATLRQFRTNTVQIVLQAMHTRIIPKIILPLQICVEIVLLMIFKIRPYADASQELMSENFSGILSGKFWKKWVNFRSEG